MKEVRKTVKRRISKKDKRKVKKLTEEGFVFTGKSRVCGHCDFSCTDD